MNHGLRPWSEDELADQIYFFIIFPLLFGLPDMGKPNQLHLMKMKVDDKKIVVLKL